MKKFWLIIVIHSLTCGFLMGRDFEDRVYGAFVHSHLYEFRTKDNATLKEFFEMLAYAYNLNYEARGLVGPIEFNLSKVEDELINQKFEFQAKGLTVEEVFYIVQKKLNLYWKTEEEVIYIIHHPHSSKYDKYLTINKKRISNALIRVEFKNSGNSDYKLFGLNSWSSYFLESGVWTKEFPQSMDNFSMIIPRGESIRFEINFKENVEYIILNLWINDQRALIGFER